MTDGNDYDGFDGINPANLQYGNPNNLQPGTGVEQPPIAMPPPQAGQDVAIAAQREAAASRAQGFPGLPPNHPIVQQARQRKLAEQSARQAVGSAHARSVQRAPAPPPVPGPSVDLSQLGSFVAIASNGRGMVLELATVNGEGINGFALVATNEIGAISLVFVPAPV